MRAAKRSLYAGASDSPLNDCRHSADMQGSPRGLHTNKETGVLNRRTPSLQVIQNSVTYLLCERELYLVARLPRHADRGMRPIDIVEIHPENIAGTQSQACQQQNRGAIPESDGGVAIATGDDTLDIGRWQVARQRGKAPHRDGWHGIVPFLCDTFPEQSDNAGTFALRSRLLWRPRDLIL